MLNYPFKELINSTLIIYSKILKEQSNILENTFYYYSTIKPPNPEIRILRQY